MTPTDTLPQLFKFLHTELTRMQLDVESNPASWHKSIQRAIKQGAFCRLDFGYGLAGPLVCNLVLVSPNGDEVLPVSPLGADHV